MLRMGNEIIANRCYCGQLMDNGKMVTKEQLEKRSGESNGGNRFQV